MKFLSTFNEERQKQLCNGFLKSFPKKTSTHLFSTALFTFPNKYYNTVVYRKAAYNNVNNK